MVGRKMETNGGISRRKNRPKIRNSDLLSIGSRRHARRFPDSTDSHCMLYSVDLLAVDEVSNNVHFLKTGSPISKATCAFKKTN